jgi:uncharacterized protein
MDVLCDTSFLMVIVSKPIKQVAKIEAQFGRLDFLVPDIVIGELERLMGKAGPKRSTLAKTALEVLRVKNFKVVIDTALRRRLIANEVLVLTLSEDRLIVANPKLSSKDQL